MGKGKVSPEAGSATNDIDVKMGGDGPAAAEPAPKTPLAKTPLAKTPLAEGNCLERGFERLGRAVARSPWLYTFGALIVMVGLCSGFATLEAENRPDKQWVPEGAVALDHQDYVRANWPSNARWNSWIAQCATPGCNMLDAAHLGALATAHERVMSVVVDGDAIVADLDDSYLEGDLSGRAWAKFAGKWSFDSLAAQPDAQRKCFQFGPNCARSSLLAAFETPGDNATQLAAAVGALTDASALAGINTWADTGGNGARMPSMAGGLTQDGGGDYATAEALMGSYTITMDDVFIQKAGRTLDPVADAWEASALCALGVDMSVPCGCPSSGDCFNGKGEFCPGVPGFDSALDPNACTAPGAGVVSLKPNFMRSLGDEFGVAIRADVSKLGSAYMLMLLYLVIMLSGWDPVNSMVGMSVVVLIIVGLSFGGCMGIGSFIGLYNNNLNNNIPFLLLGLGVDDAFVLTSEFRRACKQMPGSSIEDRIGSAMSTGGMSILITSVTDALAFLVGSATVLPALSWFCTFAGIGVILCFLLQIFLFMPCLAINAKRAESDGCGGKRLDCCCCFKARDDTGDWDSPKGCCYCSCACCLKPNKLAGFFENTLGPFITSSVGRVITLSLFLVVAVLGVVGATQIYKDFKLEWFIPDESYVNEFFDANDQYSDTGTRVSIYTKDQDYFAIQNDMQALSEYVTSTTYVDSTDQIGDWHAGFLAWAAAGQPASVDVNGRFTDQATFYAQLMVYLDGAGSASRSNVKWVSAGCNSADAAERALCDTAEGVVATRLSMSLNLTHTTTGTDRFETLTNMRSEVGAIVTEAFPFSFEFLYWEEVGVIDEELTRNLVICGAVIAFMVFSLLRNIQVSAWVVGCIILSIIDVVGLLYFWDVTISGVSTIYILICVGLAVDYAAHIAHMFCISEGTSAERACKALGRIGPSVLNAVISTFLAVIVIGFSTSYVFVVFFKAFFLVTVVAGAHGLWLLPCLLGLLGGDNVVGNGADGVDPQVAKGP